MHYSRPDVLRAAPILVLCVACATEPATSTTEHGLTAVVKHERVTLIRDSAAEMGVYNAALLGGIATSETNLAHCQSEATFACMGPASSSCGGGPIIAGSADGPCSDMQGGLGMFQFDAGTYAQTIAAYGDDILTVEGNTAQAVAFVVDKVKLDIAGATDWTSAVAWINSVPLVAGDPVTEQWASLIACRYNGCCSQSATCTTRAKAYRDNAIDLVTSEGADFWHTADRCVFPDDGVIDQRSLCYVAAGEPRFWRREVGGYNNDYEWTNSTAAAAPANFAQWLLRPGRATTYHLEVNLESGAATAATYQIVHAGITDTVTIDQSTATGFVRARRLRASPAMAPSTSCSATTPATADQKLVFDALRVTALDGGGGSGSGSAGHGDSSGGCSTGGGASCGVALVLLALRRKRRR